MTSQAIGYTTRWSQMKVLEVDTSSDLKPTQLLVDVSYIAVNPIDIKAKTLAVLPRNHILGKEFSGVVEKVGNDLTAFWSPGDRICGLIDSPFSGVLGSKAVIDVNKHAVMKSPHNLSDAQCAGFPLAFSTALEMLERTWKHGKILILGGGSNVGSYVVQLAKQKYMFTEVVATCSEKSAFYLKSVGADKCIDYKEESKSLSTVLKELDTKFDAILDTVGGYDALKVWPDILKRYEDGGVYISIVGDRASKTYKEGIIRPLVPALPWMIPRLLIGRQMGINYQLVHGKSTEWTKQAAEFFEKNQVFKIRIADIFPMSQVDQACSYVENINGRGKVLVKMNERLT